MIRSTHLLSKVTPVAARGMVVAAHSRGAGVGAAILKRGGNAIDAAVATAFAMTVVEPFMSSIAGGGTMLIHLAKRGETVALDFNVQAPAACHEAIYPLAEGIASDLFPWRKVHLPADVSKGIGDFNDLTHLKSHGLLVISVIGFWKFGDHDGCVLFLPWQLLPDLFGDEWHERMERSEGGIQNL